MLKSHVAAHISGELIETRISENSENLRLLADSEFAERITDFAAIHASFFTNEDAEVQQHVGAYRTKKAIVRYLTEGRVLSVDTLTPAKKISERIDICKSIIEKIVEADLDRDNFLYNLSFFTVLFFRTHPFSDGNGHVLRFIVRAVCERKGFAISEKWTVRKRPYGSEMGYAIRNYSREPALLFGILRRYIGNSPFEDNGLHMLVQVGNCAHCDEIEDLFERQSCLYDCTGDSGGGGGGDDGDGDSFLTWLSEILDQSD